MTALNFLFMCIISLSISGKNYRGQQVIPDIYREQKLNKDSVPYKIISKNGIAREYQAVPDACSLMNGDIVVVFYDGDDHVTYPNAEYPDAGRICLTRSKDEGRTWSNPVVIYDDVNDNRDPHINQMNDGSLILSFFSLEFEVSGSQGSGGEEPSYSKEQMARFGNNPDLLHEQQPENSEKKVRPAGPVKWTTRGPYILKSFDNGKTWKNEAKLITTAVPGWNCSAKVKEMPDGKWLLPAYRSDPSKKAAWGGVIPSCDKGKTWGKVVPIGREANLVLAAETDVVLLKDETLFAALRGDRSVVNMHYATSSDFGKNWSPVKDIGFVGHAPSFTRLATGEILLSYRAFCDKTGYYTGFQISRDEAKTWEGPYLVDNTPGAYPSTIELKDGSILMIYYEEGKGSSIRALRFKLPEASFNRQFPEPGRVDVLPLDFKEPLTKTSANWQLFIDDYWIAKSTNSTTKLHQPERNSNNPLIRADVPWEENPYCFGTVIFDEEDSIFKFWYQSYNHVEVMQERTPILYSTSTDGINWFRPNLGIIEYQGSTDNNIVLQNYGFHDLYSPSVIKDNEDSNPDKRYKMIWWDFPLGEKGYQDDGMCIAFSPDGIHWKKHPGNPVLHANKTAQSISDVMSVMQDKNTGKFVAYTKGWAEPWPAFRQIVRTESSDFIHWSEPEVVISHKHDMEDPQSYGMTVSQYGNSYIGLLHSYKKPGDETIDVQLTVSHDNKKWERVSNQQTFLPLGKPGSWDDGMLFCAPMFNHDDKTLIYYGGWDNSHNSKEPRRSGIGLATLRLNGFVSLDAGHDPATVTTNAIQNADGPLLVNANAGGGFLRAALIDADGNTISGYSLEDCLPIDKDGIAQVVRWKKHSELPKKVNVLSIKFEMINTELYGFFAGPEAKRAN